MLYEEKLLAQKEVGFKEIFTKALQNPEFPIIYNNGTYWDTYELLDLCWIMFQAGISHSTQTKGNTP